MRILTVCQHYWPERFQVTEVCEELARRGHKVTALVGIPNYPTGVVPEEYRDGGNRDQRVNGVRVVRCEEVPRSPGILGLARNYLSYMRGASHRLDGLSGPFDVVFAYQLSPVLMAAPAAKAKRRFGVPELLYCADIWPDAAMAMLPRGLGFVLPIIRRASTSIYASADAIATNSRAYIDCFESVHRLDRKRCSYLPQYADDACLDMDLSAAPAGKTRFAVMGNIGRLQDMPGMLRAVERLKDRDDFELHVVGTGSVIGQCEEYVRRNGLEGHVVFHGRRPYEEMPDFYRMADCCLLTLNVPGAPWISSTLPSRLQGYMAAGKPILAAISGSAAEVIGESGCGRAVAAGDDEGLASLMEDFIDHPGRYAGCGEAGRSYFRSHFTKERYMDGIEELLIETAGGGRDA